MSSDEINVYGMWLTIKSRLGLYLVMAIAPIILAVLIAVASQKVYRAEASVVPADSGMNQDMGSLTTLASIAGLDMEESSGRDALAILQSRTFAKTIIIENSLLDRMLPGDNGPSEDASDRPTLNDGIDYFFDKVFRVVEQSSGVIKIRVDWPDPDVAAQLANEIVRRINVHMRERAVSESGKSLEYLRERLADTDLTVVEQAISKVIEAKIQEATLAETREDFSFRIVDPAMAPDSDDFVKPQRLIIVLQGILLGQVVALFSIFFLRLVETQKRRLLGPHE